MPRVLWHGVQGDYKRSGTQLLHSAHPVRATLKPPKTGSADKRRPGCVKRKPRIQRGVRGSEPRSRYGDDNEFSEDFNCNGSARCCSEFGLAAFESLVEVQFPLWIPECMNWVILWHSSEEVARRRGFNHAANRLLPQVRRAQVLLESVRGFHFRGSRPFTCAASEDPSLMLSFDC